MPSIHATAVVSTRARIAPSAQLGPFCVIEEEVTIGERCRLATGVVVKKGTRLGSDNHIAERAVLGGAPQHLRAGTQTGTLRIGDSNMIRENVTIHRGLTPSDTTCIGDQNLIMVNAHVAHDCQIGNQVILANNVLLAGHIEVGDRAYLSGAVAVHQFCRIGPLAMVGGQAHVKKDVPPYVTVDGKSSLIVGLNLIGLRRAGYDAAVIEQLKAAYRLIYRSGMRWSETLHELGERFASGPAADFHAFLSTGGRGFLQERRTPRAATVKLPAAELPNPPPPARKAG